MVGSFCKQCKKLLEHQTNGFCDKTCRTKHWYAEKRKANPSTIYSYTCQICSKGFGSSFPPGAKNSPRNCKEKECRKEAYRRWARKFANGGAKTVNEFGEKPCRSCNKLFKPADRGQGHTFVCCSAECDEKDNQAIILPRLRTQIRQKKYGAVKAGDVTDAIFYSTYKEPLRPVDKGYGFHGTVLYSPKNDLIQCHECGEWAKTLYGRGHLQLHNLSQDQYKEKYGLARKTKLVAEGLRKKQAQNYINRSPEFHKQAAIELAKYQSPEHKKTMTGKTIRLETRNKRGNCPDQLLDKMIQAVDEKGRISQDLFIRRWGNHYLSTIRLIYGSWEEAVRLTGFVSGRQQPIHSYTDIELLNYLKQFYDVYKRTPTSSDFSRGFLPSTHSYMSRFGSLNSARTKAGIPNLILGGRGHWLEAKNIVGGGLNSE